MTEPDLTPTEFRSPLPAAFGRIEPTAIAFIFAGHYLRPSAALTLPVAQTYSGPASDPGGAQSSDPVCVPAGDPAGDPGGNLTRDPASDPAGDPAVTQPVAQAR